MSPLRKRSRTGGGQELSEVAVNADTVGPATHAKEDSQTSSEDEQGTLSDHTMEGSLWRQQEGRWPRVHEKYVFICK